MRRVYCYLQKEKTEEKGIALVLTLLILTVLVISGLEFNRATRVEATLAGNFRDLTQASYIAQSGVEIARAIIREDEPSYDSLDENWAQFEFLAYLSSSLFKDGHFAGRIVDESAKLNINGLIDAYGNVDLKKKPQLERLITQLGHDPEGIDSILDWLDPDELRRPMGAEREYYSALKPSYVPKNGPLDTLGEMLLIKGIDPSIFYGNDERDGLREYLTLYSEGKININTASLPVLMSLSPKVDQAMAQAVLDHRRQKPFKKPEDLRSIPGWEAVYPLISSEITVRSDYFSLEVLGIYHEARALVQTVIKREGKRTRILYWKAG